MNNRRRGSPRGSKGSGDSRGGFGGNRDSGSSGGSFGGNRGGFGGNRGGSFGNRAPKQMHKVICADCGNECEVPFKPTGDRPVYCRDCFAKHKKV